MSREICHEQATPRNRRSRKRNVHAAGRAALGCRSAAAGAVALLAVAALAVSGTAAAVAPLHGRLSASTPATRT